MSADINEIIGFDLGHGDTAVSRINLNHSNPVADPEILELHSRPKQPTAIAFNDHGQVVFGEDAFAPGTSGFDLGFKVRPATNGAAADAMDGKMRAYFEAVLSHLQYKRLVSLNGESHVFVGTPSDWSVPEREAYKQLLSNPLAPNLTTIPESRAALMHAKESGRLRVGELGAAVLLIDVGSSTTDFTLVNGLCDKPEDFGQDLGASLIDKELLRYFLEEHPEREALSGIFQAHPDIMRRVELVCRKNKEKFFSSPESHENGNGTKDCFENIQRRYMFTAEITGPIMRQILDTPLAALGDKSWPQAFSDELCRVRDHLSEKNISPAVVLLTGGASRMQFVRDEVEEIFPQARFVPDAQPEFAIAAGLARWGRVDIRTRRFAGEVEAMLDNTLEKLVSEQLPTIKAELATSLAGGVLSIVNAEMTSWREGSTPTLNGMEARMGELARAYLAGEEAKALILEAVNTGLRPVQTELDRETQAIAERYGLQGARAFNIRTNLTTVDPESFFIGIDDPSLITEIVDWIIMIIVGFAVAAVFVALGATGPLGWLLAALLWAIGAGATKESAREKIKAADIPERARKMLMSPEKQQSELDKQRPELTARILALLDEPEITASLTDQIESQLREAVRQEADKARLLIL